MSKILFVTALVASAGSAACAQAQSPWYVSGDLGGYFREGSNGQPYSYAVEQTGITAHGVQKDAYGPGLTGHLAVGRRIGAHLRLEAEVGAAGYDISKVQPAPNSAIFPPWNTGVYKLNSGGGQQRITESVNAFYDFRPLAFGITPYLGAGVGAWEGRSAATVNRHWVTFTLNGVSETGMASYAVKGQSDTEAFAMVEGGLSLKLASHWAVVPAYRYQRAFDNTSNRAGDVAHIAKLGLRYSF